MSTIPWQERPEWKDDPIWADQLRVLHVLLGDDLTDQVIEGFRIVAGRFVDDFGGHRTLDLGAIFKTDFPAGVRALRRSLEAVQRTLGSFEQFEKDYPVTINPSVPAFSMLPILGIDTLALELYRVVDSKRRVRDEHGVELGLTNLEYVLAHGCLPPVKVPQPVERAKPRGVHWCSYTPFPSPSATQAGLQIWKAWNDCCVRFTLRTTSATGLAYVPFNGDYPDPAQDIGIFDGYYFEPATQDHRTDESDGNRSLAGGAVQIAVFGAPPVERVECWNHEAGCWSEWPFKNSAGR